jgi:hypothetical protein
MGEKSGSGSGMNIIYPITQKQFFGVKILKFFYADPGSGMERIRIRESGMAKTRIRDQE